MFVYSFAIDLYSVFFFYFSWFLSFLLWFSQIFENVATIHQKAIENAQKRLNKLERRMPRLMLVNHQRSVLVVWCQHERRVHRKEKKKMKSSTFALFASNQCLRNRTETTPSIAMSVTERSTWDVFIWKAVAILALAAKNLSERFFSIF